MILKRFVAASVLAALCLAFLPASASAQRRAVRVQRPRATVVIAGGYPRHIYDPWGPWGPYDWYGAYPYRQRYVYDGASVRIQVTPKGAEVYVDGYLAGNVDEFDGTFQRLRVEPGEHEIAVWADGFQTLRRRVYIQPLSTVNIKETLERLQPGDTQEGRPEPAPATAAAGAGSPTPAQQRTGRPAPRSRGRTETPEPREPAPTTRAAENATFGVLSVRVQPGGAEVIIDGERWEGPDGEERLLVQLGPGAHRIEVRRAGYQTFSRSVDIEAGQTETLNVSLTRQ